MCKQYISDFNPSPKNNDVNEDGLKIIFPLILRESAQRFHTTFALRIQRHIISARLYILHIDFM